MSRIVLNLTVTSRMEYRRDHRTRVTLLLGLALLMAGFVPVPRFILAQALTVTRVIDGDTFELSDGRRVHLLGVRAPERYVYQRDSKHPGAVTGSVLSLGKDAAQLAENLVLGRRVLIDFEMGLEPVTEPSVPHRSAHVHVVDETDSLLFNVGERMIAAGFATVDTATPTVFLNYYLTVQQEAALSGRGLWAAVTPEMEALQRRKADRLKSPPVIIRSSRAVDLLGECSGHPDCVLIFGPDGGLGVWQSRVGGKCPCDE